MVEDKKPSVVEIVPVGERGRVRVEHYEVTPEASEVSKMRAIFNPMQGSVKPGKYARLMVNNRIMMSDTQYEWETNQRVIEEARGDVLIGGLGLGMILGPILGKEEVKSVVVVEKSLEVIELVAPYYKDSKLTAI